IAGAGSDGGGGVVLFPDHGDRTALASQIVGELRRHGYRVLPADGWDDYDARVVGSALLYGELVTSAHPIGSVQMKVRRRFRAGPAIALAIGVCVLAVANIWVGAVAAAAVVGPFVVGLRRAGGTVRRVGPAAASA